MKAQNEAEALEHMEAAFRRGGGKLSGKNERWTIAKVHALNAMAQDADIPFTTPPEDAELFSILDLGIGDMMHWERWQPFLDEAVDYLGIDGCQEIIEAMTARHETRAFLHFPFSKVVASHQEGFRYPVDCIVALDVLYHIPEDDIYEGMVRMLFGDGPHRYVLVSYSTDIDQRFADAKGVGHPGFAWFPRPWQEHLDWEAIHTETFEGLQRQELTLYRRR